MNARRSFPSFTAEMEAHGQLHAVFIRSPYARARLGAIDIEPALAHPGVMAVWTGRDLAEAGVAPLGVIPFGGAAEATGSEWGLQRGLAREEASYEGQPVAVVVAATPWAAEQAAEAVKIDWIELTPALTVDAAASPGAPVVAGGAGNIAVEFEHGDADRTALALAASALTTTLRLRHPRRHPVSLEPRACLARFDGGSGRLSLHVSNECPHLACLLYSRMLGVPVSRLRVIAPRVGGGFGARRVVPVEEAVIAWAAMRLGRPIRWVSQRTEAFLAEAHEAEAESVATIGFDPMGRITALGVRCRFAVGARLSTFGAGFAERLAQGLVGGYSIPVMHFAASGWFTNTAPTDIIDEDGAGAATLILERVIDAGARRLGMDPATLRLRNGVRDGDRGLPSGAGNSSSTFVLERLLERVGYGTLQGRTETLRARGCYIGLGISCYSATPPDTENGAQGDPAQAGPGSFESGPVRIHPDGSVSVHTGRAARGGDTSETAIVQLVAEQLGVAGTDIVVVAGDTDASTFEAVVPGKGSLRRIEAAIRTLREQTVRIAAARLGVGVDEVEVGGEGYSTWRGGERRRLTLADLAAVAYRLAGAVDPPGPGATVARATHRDHLAGAHAAVVEIDAETGRVELKRYVAIDEAGSIGDGVAIDVGVRGSIMRGISRALWEEARYRSTGGLSSVSLMTYPVPVATSRMPEIETEQVRSRTAERSGLDPGGIATPAAIANAVADALSPLGIEHLDLPYTPERVWEAIRRANQGAG